ncbi:MAG TPA: hypothetical protein PK891_03435, partial [Bacteroidales bacterium]|nr:hypothetical protein [Bacteroidales bacterium]
MKTIKFLLLFIVGVMISSCTINNYYTQSQPYDDVYYNPNSITQDLLETTVDNIKVDRTPLDLLFQVMLELGIELSAKIEE